LPKARRTIAGWKDPQLRKVSPQRAVRVSAIPLALKIAVLFRLHKIIAWPCGGANYRKPEMFDFFSARRPSYARFFSDDRNLTPAINSAGP